MTNTNVDSEVAAFDAKFLYRLNQIALKGIDVPLYADMEAWLRESLTRIAAASKEEGYEEGQDSSTAIDALEVQTHAYEKGRADAIAMVKEKLPKFKDIDPWINVDKVEGYNKALGEVITLLSTLPTNKDI